MTMTDERLRDLCEQEPGLDANDAEEVLTELKAARGHIAALTAERDEHETKWRACSALAVERGATADALRERVKALEGQVKTLAVDKATLLAQKSSPPSELDGLRGEMADTSGLERTDYRAPPANDVLETPTTPESTAAEALAKLHAYLSNTGAPDTEWDSSEEVVALSLLERRMGAQEAVLRGMAGCNRYRAPDECGSCWGCRARAALTDAPPVFTLEEVLGVFRAEGAEEVDLRRLSERLTALRK